MAKKRNAETAAAADDVFVDRPNPTQAFIDDFNKRNRKKDGTPRATLMRASDYELPYYNKRLPTGLLTLDVALGGGFPAGGLSQIAGPKNSGKSWLCWQVMRQQQFYRGDDFRGLLAMTEMRADRGQARLAGVKIALGKQEIELQDRARIANGKTPYTAAEKRDLMTEVGEIHELHAESAEVLYDGILEAVANNVYHVIVIDSLGSIMSAAEAESESLEDKTYGGAAKVNSEFLRKLNALLTMSYKDPDTGKMKTRETCIIGINQVRDNIGDRFKEYRTTGGKALEHAKFVDLWVFSSSPEFREDPKAGKVQTGKWVRWQIEKGKAGIHEGARGSYLYDFGIGTVDFYLDTITAGIACGVLEQAGAWIGIPNPESPGNYLLREMGKERFTHKLAANADEMAAAGTPEMSLMNYIRNEVFRRHGIDVLNSW